ncbi:MAG: DMT family transporter, partial [Acidimicrobiia bacterium]|nr:DMT family transporter [Acidimicrobiia bacterium]
MAELFVGHEELLTQLAEPVGHLGEATLQERPWHGGHIRRLLLLAFIWGWSFLLIKVAGDGMTPPTVAFLRVTLGAIVLRGWLRHTGVGLPRDRATWRNFVVVGACSSAVPFTLLAWGEQRTATALTAVANASTPLFAAVCAAVLVRERLRLPQLVGLAVGFVGVGVAAGLGASDLTSSSTAGVLASVLAGAFYGLAATWMGKHLTHLPPAAAAGGQLTVASALLAPFALGTTLVDGFHPTPTRLLAIAVLGVVGTGLAYLIFYRVIADLGATKASVVTYVIPVVAIAVGALVLDERFTIRIVVGGALVVAGIALVNGLLRRPRRLPAGAMVLVAVVALSTTPLA